MTNHCKYIKIKIVGLIPDYPKGSIIKVKTDDEGTPLSFFWRRCLKAAKIDGSCEIVKPKTVVPESRRSRSRERSKS